MTTKRMFNSEHMSINIIVILVAILLVSVLLFLSGSLDLVMLLSFVVSLGIFVSIYFFIKITFLIFKPFILPVLIFVTTPFTKSTVYIFSYIISKNFRMKVMEKKIRKSIDPDIIDEEILNYILSDDVLRHIKKVKENAFLFDSYDANNKFSRYVYKYFFSMEPHSYKMKREHLDCKSGSKYSNFCLLVKDDN